MLDNHSSSNLSQFHAMNQDHPFQLNHSNSAGHYNKFNTSSAANQRSNRLKNELDLQLLNIMQQSAASPPRNSGEKSIAAQVGENAAEANYQSDDGSEGEVENAPQSSTNTLGQANRGYGGGAGAVSSSKKQHHLGT